MQAKQNDRKSKLATWGEALILAVLLLAIQAAQPMLDLNISRLIEQAFTSLAVPVSSCEAQPEALEVVVLGQVPGAQAPAGERRMVVVRLTSPVPAPPAPGSHPVR